MDDVVHMSNSLPVDTVNLSCCDYWEFSCCLDNFSRSCCYCIFM